MRRINAEEFIKVYMNSDTWDEAANRLGMPVNQLKGRVKAYRKRGIKLPLKSWKSGKKLNVNRLNDLIKELK